jgi:hypothetical protein
VETKVKESNINKLFKIVKFNLHGRVEEWFKKLNLAPIDQRFN